MNLIIDTGNTRTKIAVFEQDMLVCIEKIKTEKLLHEVKEKLKKFKIDGIIVSSVAQLSSELTFFLSKKDIHVVFLDSKTKIPFKNLYKTPTTLGVDRIALMAAAQKKYPNQNVLVIDAGTCITYDFINSANEYYGGAIAPGLNMKYKAMHHFTKNLPLLKPKINIKIEVGDSTKNAMHQGVINGTVLEMDGVIKQYQKENNNLTIVLTGGDTIFLAKLLKSGIFANPYFLLEGLNYILNYNS